MIKIDMEMPKSKDIKGNFNDTAIILDIEVVE